MSSVDLSMSLMSWKIVEFVFAVGRNTQFLRTTTKKKKKGEKQIIEVLISSLLIFHITE